MTETAGPRVPPPPPAAPPRESPLLTLIGQIYAMAGMLAFVATFLPLWAELVPGDTFATMSLWKAAMISNTGGDIAMLGLILGLVMVGSMFLASYFARRSVVPAVVAVVLCIPALLLLITKPYSSTPKPDLGTGGATMLALIIVLILTVVVHVIAGALGAGRRPR